MPGAPTAPADIAALRAGDRQTLAQAITLAESRRAGQQEDTLRLLEALGPVPDTARTVGITGSPGVGKSTFIERFGLHAIGQGRKVAVLAVDPTSPLAGGSILADKTRMPGLAAHPSAFVRPSPSGAALGGLHEHAFEVILLLAHAGYNLVLLETVGIGQAEIAVAALADLTLLLLQPGGGDELQGIKKGVMEVADMLAVTKMDGAQADLARHAVADYRQALGLRADGSRTIRGISSLTGEGIADLYTDIEARLAVPDAVRRRERHAAWFQSRSIESARQALLASEKFQTLREGILTGTLDPITAIREMGESSD